MMGMTLRSSSSVHLILEHVAEEEGTEETLPPTINMSLNEFVMEKKKKKKKNTNRAEKTRVKRC
jgi:hypothetical protein